MPVKRSSTGGALAWILAVVLVSVAAIGVGWLIGQQVLNLLNPGRNSISQTNSGDTGYSYYPWKEDQGQGAAAPGTPSTGTPAQPNAASADTPKPVTPTPVTPAATPAVTPAGAAANAPLGAAAPSGPLYRVKVGSFGTKDAAMVTARELEAQGYPIFVTGSGPYAVQVGAFAKRENAIALSDTLVSQGYEVVINE